MDAQPTLIGKTGYPKDNSYSFTIGTEGNPLLAGTRYSPAKKVTIVSEPFEMKVKLWNDNTVDTHIFVTVKYNRKLHIVLNVFRDLK